MKPIGMQLYSVRDEARDDLPGTLVNIAQMGYEGIEFFGHFPHAPSEIRSILNDHGLKGIGYHVKLDWLYEDTLNETVEMLLELEIRTAVVAVLPDEFRRTREDWLRAASFMNTVEPLLARHGIRLGYHNHDMEFRPVGGDLPMNLLFERFSPQIFMELDIGHAVRAGADPLAFLETYRDRQPLLHVREFSPNRETALIGEGEVDWAGILPVCEREPSIEWYIIEQEHAEGSPLAAAKTSLKNLRELLAFSID